MWPFAKRSPQTAAAKLRAGTKALARRDIAAAVAWLSDVVAEKPEDIIALLNLGAAYHYLEQHTRALEYFQCVTALQPAHARAWLNIAAARSALGHLQMAEEALQKVIAIDPDFPNVHYNLAVVKIRLARPFEALAELELQMADKPNHADARELLEKLRAQVI